MIKKLLKYLGITLFIYVFSCVITPFNGFLKNRSIKNQITYLSRLMDLGYDNQLQRRYPEGKIFSNSLLSLSVMEYCERNAVSNEKYAGIVDNCIRRMLSESALRTFSPNMKPTFGMFYNGWTNYVLTSYLESDLIQHSSMPIQVQEMADSISHRLISEQLDSLRILESYYDANWPADNLVGLLSIQNDTIQKQWLDKIIATTEHQSGLIHHSGTFPSIIRGSSQALITFCLTKLKYAKISPYSKQFDDIFIDNYLGVLLVKENEDGSNNMDVDSGPVVSGYGASATIMNIKTQASLGNKKSKNTWAAMNLISVPINLFGKKFYLLKKEPMYDLFMLWAGVEL